MSTTQPSRTDTPGRRQSLRRWTWLAGAVVAIAAVGLGLAAGQIKSGNGKGMAVFPAAHGPLTISVTASGSIRNSDAVVLRNEVQGSATILFIVDEGTMVKQGELLVELDSSKLLDQKVDQEIKVKSDHAAYINAEEALKITHKEGESEIKTAEVALELAILDLEKYLGVDVYELLGLTRTEGKFDLAAIAEQLSRVNPAELDLSKYEANDSGEYSQELKQANNKIDLTREELKRAETKYDGSKRLHTKGYISQTELEADRLELERKTRELEVAQKELQLLERYTKRRSVAELLSGVDQKAFALLKARHKAASDAVDAEATLQAKKLAYEREQYKLDKLTDQIAKCKVVAPCDGMVVYGARRSRYDEPLKQGMQVIERQELIRLPQPGGMVAEIKIQESMLDRIREGLPAVITFEALPGKEFPGRVKKVALVPDEEDRWLNPDSKVYKTEVGIDSGDDSLLKPGMSCSAQIFVHHYPEAVYVPVQAVLRIKGEPTVYVIGSNGQPEPRPVQVGLDNNRMIAIAGGLKEGERVLLDPPLPPAERPQGRDMALAGAIPPAAPAPDSTSTANAPPTSAPAAEEAPPAAEGPTAPTSLAGGESTDGLRERLQAMTADERRQFFQSEEGQRLIQQFQSRRGGAGRRPPAEGQAPAAPPGTDTAAPQPPAG